MHNHAGSRWLRASSDVLSHSSSCLLIAHVAPLRNSRSNPEEALCESRFHSIIYRYFGFRVNVIQRRQFIPWIEDLPFRTGHILPTGITYIVFTVTAPFAYPVNAQKHLVRAFIPSTARYVTVLIRFPVKRDTRSGQYLQTIVLQLRELILERRAWHGTRPRSKSSLSFQGKVYCLSIQEFYVALCEPRRRASSLSSFCWNKAPTRIRTFP